MPPESHMFVLSPDGTRAYTANVAPAGKRSRPSNQASDPSQSQSRKHVQRISISPDGRYVYTQDQTQPRIAVIDTSLQTKLTSGSIFPLRFILPRQLRTGICLVANSPSGKLFVVELVY